MFNLEIKLNNRPTGEWIDYILFNWFDGIKRIQLYLYKKLNLKKYIIYEF